MKLLIEEKIYVTNARIRLAVLNESTVAPTEIKLPTKIIALKIFF